MTLTQVPVDYLGAVDIQRHLGRLKTMVHTNAYARNSKLENVENILLHFPTKIIPSNFVEVPHYVHIILYFFYIHNKKALLL